MFSQLNSLYFDMCIVWNNYMFAHNYLTSYKEGNELSMLQNVFNTMLI